MKLLTGLAADLFKGLMTLLRHFILVAFGDLVEGGALQPEVHFRSCYFISLMHYLPASRLFASMQWQGMP